MILTMQMVYFLESELKRPKDGTFFTLVGSVAGREDSKTDSGS